MAIVIAMYYAVSWTLQTNTRQQLCRRKIYLDLFQVNFTHIRILVNDKKEQKRCIVSSFNQFYVK